MINDWKRLAWEAPNLSHSLTTIYTKRHVLCMMMTIIIIIILCVHSLPLLPLNQDLGLKAAFVGVGLLTQLKQPFHRAKLQDFFIQKPKLLFNERRHEVVEHRSRCIAHAALITMLQIPMLIYTFYSFLSSSSLFCIKSLALISGRCSLDPRLHPLDGGSARATVHVGIDV